MHERNYITKTKGASKDKLYQCHMRYIFGVNIDDLITLIGQAAVRPFTSMVAHKCIFLR